MTKFKRILAAMLTVVLLFQSLELTLVVNASQISNIMTPTDIVLGAYDPVYFPEEAYIPESDYEALFDPVNLREPDKTYSLLSDIEKIMWLMDVDESQAYVMLGSYGDTAQAVYEAQEYWALSNNMYGGSCPESVKSLVLNGVGAQRALYSYAASEILGLNHLDAMLSDDEIPGLYELTDEYLIYLAGVYYLSPECSREYCAETGMTSELTAQLLNDAFKELYPNSGIEALAADEEEMPKAAPYYVNSSENEAVSVVSGSLIYKYDIAHIPGVNGMDIDLTLKYDSAYSSIPVKETVKSEYRTDPIVDSSGNRIGSSERSKTTTTYGDYDWSNKTALMPASGWRLDLDRIEKNFSTPKIVFTDGSECEINSKTTSDTVTYSLTGINSKRLSLEPDFGTYYDSKYKLTFEDGTKEYFNDDGYITAKVDRFGNRLTFVYSDISIPVDIVGSDDVFTKRMTVSNGTSTVNIDYSLTNQRVTMPDGSVIRFKFTKSHDDYLLESITDAEGLTTTFEYYSVVDGPETYSNGFSNGSYSYAAIYEFLNRLTYNYINKITYPTGAVTEYTYAKGKNRSFNGVSERKDIDRGREAGKVTYSYNDTSTVRTEGDLSNTYTYWDTGYVIDETYFLDGLKYINDYSYDLYSSKTGKLSGFEKKIYGKRYGTIIGAGSHYDSELGCYVGHPIYDFDSYATVKDYCTYDVYGCVTSKTINGVKYTYTYDPTYHIMTSCQYTSGGMTVKEVNTLTADKKNIKTKSIYVNNILSGKTEYTYNSNGCVLTTKEYKSSGSYVLTTNTYNPSGWLALTTTAGVTKSYTYDIMGRALTETDGNGFTTSYTYDIKGRLTQKANPDGTSENRYYTVSTSENSMTVVDEAGYYKKYDYDQFGNLLTVVDNAITVKSIVYDDHWRIASEQDLNGITRYTYNAKGDVASKKVYSLTNSETPVYEEQYVYDFDCDLKIKKNTKTIVGDSSSPSLITVSYIDMRDRVVKEGQSDGTTELLTSYTYDALGNKLTDLSPLDAQNGFTSTNSYTYDYAGRLKRTTDPLGNTSSTSYDWLGNVTSKTDPSRTTVTYTYDDFGRVLTETVPIDSSNTKVTLYSYDGNGNKIQEVVYPQGTSAYLSRRTDYTYNQRNLLTEVKQYTSETEYIITAQYTYDVRGLMTSSNAGGYVTSYTYDSHGNLSSCTYPGETTPETYVYSADGKIRSCTDRNGVTKSYSYNALGNLIIMSTGSQIVNYGYYKNGLIYYETDGRIATPYTYDSYGRKINDGTASYAYDANSNLVSVTIGSDVTTYSYDRAGRMLSVVNGLSKTDYTYNSRGLRTSTKNYYDGNLVTQTDYTYNLAGLATSLVSRDSDGNVFSSFSYTYQFDGNVSSETDHNGIVTNYTYDLLGRLIAEVSGASSRYYTYDAAGNRTKAIVDGTTQILYAYNDKGQLVSETTTNGETSEVTSYTYDANGNLTSKAEGIKTTNYTYDTFGRMVAADGSTYTYRPDGLRASKTVDDHSQRFSYVNGKVVNDGNKKYTYGLELIKSNTAYFLYNIHGDVIQMVNPSGALLKTYNYDAYGNELTRDLNDTNPFRYCGEYYDTETGFIYLRARYYDPMVGRFTTVDPAKDGLNWYAYCNDNPIAFVDPLGLSADNAIGSSRYRSFAICAGDIDAKVDDKKLLIDLYRTAYKVQNTLSMLNTRRIIISNFEHNSKMEAEKYFGNGISYLNGQDVCSCKDYKFGCSTVAESGCEALAIYNSLYSLGITDVKLSQIIQSMEIRNAMMLFGKWGGNPYSFPRILSEYNVNAKEISAEYDFEPGTYIFSYINEGKTDISVHTVAAYYDGIRYRVYNDSNGCTSVKLYNTIGELAPNLICGFYLTR